MKKAVSYKRVATDTLRSLHNSIDHQEMAIRQYCRENHIDILESFADVASGSAIAYRPGWKSLEAFLQRHHGDISLLVVTNLDRIGRKIFLVQDKLQELETKYGVAVAAARKTLLPMNQNHSKN